ncbi:MAG: hypothetical protein WC488_04685 [Candidatus Micrarchaeia archaeon]
MIGKPEWFERRKYGGWGVVPKTREGWWYLVIMFVPFLIFQAIPFWSLEVRICLTAAWLAVVAFDTLDIMASMKNDERETMHEAIAERNAAWMMVAVLAIGLLYEGIGSSLAQAPYVDPFLAIALFAGLGAKAYTNWKLEREN